MIDLQEVGAHPLSVQAPTVRFGVYLPGIHAVDRFQVVVRIIHRDDRFDPRLQPVDVDLTFQVGHPLDLWSATVTLVRDPHSHFGLPSTYLYRYQLWWASQSGERLLITCWFTDPFARATDIGGLAAFDIPMQAVLAWRDDDYKTPELDELIVYELQVEQFNDTFTGVTDRLTYLESLGVNCLELMPVTSAKVDFDWGYGPLQYFAASAHFGGAASLRSLVASAHAREIAVILDVVYQHVDTNFPYFRVYDDLRRFPQLPQVASPMIGAMGGFGPQADFAKTFTQDFFATSNRYWLDEFHVDGFRYDEATDLYSGPTDTAYAKLAYETYRYSLGVSRFQRGAGGYSRIIQCAEGLGKAPEILRETYTNCAWQDDLLNQAEEIAAGATLTDNFAHTLDPYFAGRYPAVKTVEDVSGNPVDMPVAPFQYLNSHDHSHLSVFTGTTGGGTWPPGDRSRFYKIQPFAIALYTSQGIPMLWEGEEFNDDYDLPSWGSARVNLRRDTHWAYFYDGYGAPLIRLYRRLAILRRSIGALRSRASYYYWQQSLQGVPVIAYHRHLTASTNQAESYAVILINFGDVAGSINVPFPKAGVWAERIEEDVRAQAWNITVGAAGEMHRIDVPSNYGCIFSV